MVSEGRLFLCFFFFFVLIEDGDCWALSFYVLTVEALSSCHLEISKLCNLKWDESDR